MAKFQETMKQWKRMCKTMHAEYKCTNGGCPLYANYACESIWYFGETDPNYAEVERVVAKWAEENQEPVYPTWYRWLIMMGAVGSVEDLFSDLQRPIPADIAQKFGIKPEEG